ncbi:MAG: hypothetical protein H6737_08755 [Alphaproteobacteria bacterium]|nr:hypothetical protein [Alphaproteobacteria bacterium]
MAAHLKSELGVDVELIKGSRGVFVVRVDGVIVAQKSLDHGFPTPEQCEEAVRGAL